MSVGIRFGLRIYIGYFYLVQKELLTVNWIDFMLQYKIGWNFFYYYPGGRKETKREICLGE